MLELLNTKSVIDCTSEEQELHNKETIKMLEELAKNPEYKWFIAAFNSTDPAHSHLKKDIKSYRAAEIMDVLTPVDHKHGVDLMKDGKGYVVIRAFGQLCQQDGESHYVETKIRLVPWGNEMAN